MIAPLHTPPIALYALIRRKIVSMTALPELVLQFSQRCPGAGSRPGGLVRDAHAGPLPRVPDSRHAPVRAGGGAPAGRRAGIRGAVRRAARGRQAFAQAGRAGRAAGRGSPARRACRPCCRGAAGCARHGAPCPSAPRRRALCRRAPGSRVIAAYVEGYDELDRRVLGGLPDLAGHGPGRRQHAAGVEHAQDLPGAPAGRGLADPYLPATARRGLLVRSCCRACAARTLRAACAGCLPMAPCARRRRGAAAGRLRRRASCPLGRPPCV